MNNQFVWFVVLLLFLFPISLIIYRVFENVRKLHKDKYFFISYGYWTLQDRWNFENYYAKTYTVLDLYSIKKKIASQLGVRTIDVVILSMGEISKEQYERAIIDHNEAVRSASI